MDLKVESTLIKSVKYHNSLPEAIAVVFVIILSVVFVVKPKYDMVKAKSVELQSAQNQYQTVEADRNKMNQLITQLSGMDQQIALTDQALPLQGRITLLDELIDNLVTTAGMKLASITPDDGPSGVIAGDKQLIDDPFGGQRKLQTTTLTVTVTGPVEQFRQLLKLVETSPRLLDIDNMSISTQEGAILYKIHLKAYFYAPEYEKLQNQE